MTEGTQRLLGPERLPERLPHSPNTPPSPAPPPCARPCTQPLEGSTNRQAGHEDWEACACLEQFLGLHTGKAGMFPPTGEKPNAQGLWTHLPSGSLWPRSRIRDHLASCGWLGLPQTELKSRIQELTHCSPRAKSSPRAMSTKQGKICNRHCMWPAKSKIFTLWLFSENCRSNPANTPLAEGANWGDGRVCASVPCSTTDGRRGKNDRTALSHGSLQTP